MPLERWLRIIPLRLRSVFRRGDVERDLSEELQFHIEQETAENIRRGMSLDDARTAALRRLGNVAYQKEEVRDARGTRWIDEVVHDARYAWRALRKSPGFTLVSLLTLSVGIGAVATIFSILNALAFHPLPYADASRTVQIDEERSGMAVGYVSPAMIAEISRASSAFSGLAVYRDHVAVLSSAGDATAVDGLAVDSAVFRTLGIHAERGRLFAADDYLGDEEPLVLSDEIWRSRFGADPHLINSRIRVNGISHTVIGIVPPGMRFPYQTDIWSPLTLRISPADSGLDEWLHVLGRLRRGKSLHDAQVELVAIGKAMKTADPHRFRGEAVFARKDFTERGTMLDALIATPFLAAALCVLLVACANVGALLLVRGADRRREMAIRASLGGTQRRLMLQNLTESLMLGLTAGLLGVLISVAGAKAILATVPTDGLPSWVHFGLDGRVVFFTFATSLLATVAFGLTPAREAVRVDLAQALKAGGDGTVAGGVTSRGAQRRTVVELALSLLLFLVAAAFWQSAHRLAATDLGFERNRIMEASGLTLDQRRYPDERAAQRFADQVIDMLDASPAVEAAALTNQFDAFRTDSNTTRSADTITTAAAREAAAGLYRFGDLAHPVNAEEFEGRSSLHLEETVVSVDLPRTLGLTMRAGRWFGVADDSASPLVAVMSERLAHVLAPAGDIVGHVFQIGIHGRPITIVGVISDTRIHTGENELAPVAGTTLYFSDRQALGRSLLDWLSIVVRAKGPASTLPRVIRNAVRQTDPDVPFALRPMEFDPDEGLLLVRVVDGLIGAFALAALFLAMLGTYGVIAYDVTRRSREIGIRIALGGSTGDVMRWVILRAARFIAVGLAAGLVLGLATNRAIDAFLWGYAATGVSVDAGVLALFAAVALLACYLPARRVTRADPLAVLKAE